MKKEIFDSLTDNKFLVSDLIFHLLETQPILKTRVFALGRVTQYNFNKLEDFSLFLILYPVLHNSFRYYLQVWTSFALTNSHEGHLQGIWMLRT